MSSFVRRTYTVPDLQQVPLLYFLKNLLLKFEFHVIYVSCSTMEGKCLQVDSTHDLLFRALMSRVIQMVTSFII